MAAMAAAARRAFSRVSRILTSGGGSGGGGYVRMISGNGDGGDKALSHTEKWLSSSSEKESPMALVNAIPPIPTKGRIVICCGDPDPAQSHPIQYICLDLGGLQCASIVGYDTFPLINDGIK